MSIVETNRDLFRSAANGFYDRGVLDTTAAAGVRDGITSFRRAPSDTVVPPAGPVNFSVSVVEDLVAEGLCTYDGAGTYTVTALGAGTYEIAYYMRTTLNAAEQWIMRNNVIQARLIPGAHPVFEPDKPATVSATVVFTCAAGDTIWVRGNDTGWIVPDDEDNGFMVRRMYGTL